MAARLTAAINEQLDIESFIAEAINRVPKGSRRTQLPGRAARLGGGGFIADQVDTIVYSDRSAQFRMRANETAHREIVAMLQGR